MRGRQRERKRRTRNAAVETRATVERRSSRNECGRTGRSAERTSRGGVHGSLLGTSSKDWMVRDEVVGMVRLHETPPEHHILQWLDILEMVMCFVVKSLSDEQDETLHVLFLVPIV